MTSAFPYRWAIDIAAASKDLTVVARLAAELGVTFTTPESDLMENLIHEASALIVGCCNRELAEEKRTDHYRTKDGPVDELWVSLWPITTVHGVVEDGITLSSSLYEIDAKQGRILRLDSAGNENCWAGWAKITVQHTSGFELLPDLPHDIERACITQVLATYHSRKRDPTLRAFTVPDVYQAQFSVPGGDSFGDSGLLLSVEGALNPYIKRAL